MSGNTLPRSAELASLRTPRAPRLLSLVNWIALQSLGESEMRMLLRNLTGTPLTVAGL
jgi:hypothetical protein